MNVELDSSDLLIVKEFLKNWLPLLTKDLCGGCAAALVSRIQSLNPVSEQNLGEPYEEEIKRGVEEPNLGSVEVVSGVAGDFDGYFGTYTGGLEHIEATGWDTDPVSERSPGDSEEEQIDRHAEKLKFGSAEVASEVADGFGYFRTYTDGLENIKATGWDTDPESEGSTPNQEEEEIDRCKEESKLGSMEVASEVLGGFDGCFRASLCGLEHIKATGWDTDPESERRTDDPEEEEVDRDVGELNLDSMEVPSNVAKGLDGCFRASLERWEHVIKATGWDTDPAPELPKVRMSWADMVQQDQLEEEEEEKTRCNGLENGVDGGKEEVSREQIGFSRVGRKKDFICLERVDGRIVNILEGLELHTGVFSVLEQKKIVDFVYEFQEKWRSNGLGEHTYSEEPEPRKHMRTRGHTTIQFGCCYNYMEQNGIPPGIIHGEVADPMPNLFNIMIKRLISWHVMPASCVPDSCRVSIYEPGDFEPPYIDSHDFVRPFCTVSFLNEGSINFGSNLKDNNAGEFTGSTAIPLPVGSVLVFNGKGANVAKHCVPAVPSKRILITFRKIEKSKRPPGFRLEPDPHNIRSYGLGTDAASNIQTNSEGESFVEIRNGAKTRQNAKKERLTPNHAGIERSKDCRAILRDHEGVRDEPEEFPGRFQHSLRNDEGGGKNSRGRSVRVEEKRIIVTRSIEKKDGSFAAKSSRSGAARPQIRIQTCINGGQRTVRLIQ